MFSLKTEIDKLEKTYDTCLSTGNIKEKREVDIELIKSLQKVALSGIDFIKKQSKNIDRKSSDWTFVFRDHYEGLRGLIESYLLFDKISADSHQCKNAYICLKHPELELDWEFLETIRLKRNAINYRGQLLSYDDWKQFEIQFSLHINNLDKKISERLEEF